MVTEKKKQKLVLVTPSGREYKLGFLSPSRNGIVLGTPEVKESDTSHLTVLYREDTLSAHITPQKHSENRQYFPSLSKERIIEEFQRLTEKKLVSELSTEQMSEKVMYVTQKFGNWINSIKGTLYQKRVTSKEEIHIINVKQLLEKLPQLIEEFKEAPSSFLGLCKAEKILEDKSKIAGIIDSKLFIIPIENRLYSIDFSLLTNFRFSATLEQREISDPLTEIYHSMGIRQYMEEIGKKKILEKLLSKDE
jgi:hypothetical protein